MQPVFRFAPSPNGYLHLGHALSALLNAEAARRSGGRFLLRIEDIDVTRCQPQFVAAVYEDLAWLGLSWEQPVRRQSEHFACYGKAIARLQEMGLLYPAFESRAEIAQMVQVRQAQGAWPCDPDGAPLYPGGRIGEAAVQRRMAEGAPFALRLDMRAALAMVGELSWREQGDGLADAAGLVAAQPQAWGDIVLARKEIPTSYHLSVVIDDALQGVTHVVRGRDLFHATSVHRVLQALLHLPAPTYRHHPLLTDAEGRKLAKSAGAPSLRDLRRAGATPADVRRIVGLA